MDDERAALEAAIRSTVLDYFEGWFTGDAVRMTRALHPDLAKRSLHADGRAVNQASAAAMIDATGKGAGREVAARRGVEVDVAIVDVHGDIASATVRSSAYREYLHLARTADSWRIVNALWAPS